MITKGIRISQLVERKDLNGKEIIPFQDGIHNGKLSIQSLIDYIGDISDSDLELQALIKIQKFVDTVSEMDLLLYQAKEGDIYYCKENKKLYVRSFNKWDMLDPLTSKVYVLVGLDEYNRTNIIHLWDGNDMVVMSERLFIGEVTGTAYDGGKGKHLADIANSLPDNVIREVADFTTDGSTVTFNYEYDVKQESGLFDGDAQGSKTIPSATTSNAGVMSATDKTKLDGLKDQAGITSDIDAVQTNLETHINNKSNPHEVTKDQVGLSEVDNTSDANKPISTATQNALNSKFNASDGNAVQTNLETHINNKSNPHEVTKDQVGLSEVDNTSDANKPISTATQNALNSKFNASDGNALKQTIENMPNLVVTEGRLSHKNNEISLSLIQQDLKDQVNTDSILLKFNPATDSTAGIILPSDKTKIDKIITNGNGTKYLSDNGTYKEVSGGSSSSDINIIELRDIRDIISIVYHEKDRASRDISSVFGGSANFRAIVNDILKTHTRYFFHVKDTPDSNCIQLSGVNAWKNIDNTQYELHFIYNYYTSNGNQRTCRRVTVIDSDNTDNNLFIVENVNDMYVLSKDRDRRKSVSLVGEGFDESHWYPVSFTADPNAIVPPCNLVIWNSLNNDSSGISPKPSWATNYGGFTLHVDMSIIGSGWGQYANAKNKLNNYDGEWGGETAVGEMRQTIQTSTFYIYLRGGANYFYTSDYAGLKMTAHSSEVLDGYNTYSIKDTQGDIKDFFTYVENDLFEEVKNLQIVHNNEFNFANNSIGNYVWINYRSRYNTVTSAKAVYVGNGQAGADGAYGAVHASGFFKESDIRLKSDIAPLKHTLDQICNIPTVEFNMHDKHQIGTIAQDLENNFAEVVNTDSDGMKSVDYCMLGVVAIEGIKLLKQEVEDLKKQIEELKNGK